MVAHAGSAKTVNALRRFCCILFVRCYYISVEKFELHILGCGSALPTTRHFPSSQVVNVRDKLFMIDCGEGAQLQLRKSQLKFSRLNHVFISHLHGDHCFGLMGLISTLGLLGRTAELHIHSPRGLKELLTPSLAFFCKNLPFKVVIREFHTDAPSLIYEDRSVTVTTIPLNHRIPCCGFLFAERQGLPHIIRDRIDYYQVPVYELNRIKNGADYITPEGEVIPCHYLTSPAAPARRYAYCSDTLYSETIIEQIRGVDLLFHEATFSNYELPRARETFHSTAFQAGEIALKAQVKKLIIGHFSARYENEEILLKEACQVFPDTILANETLCVPVV